MTHGAEAPQLADITGQVVRVVAITDVRLADATQFLKDAFELGWEPRGEGAPNVESLPDADPAARAGLVEDAVGWLLAPARLPAGVRVVGASGSVRTLHPEQGDELVGTSAEMVSWFAALDTPGGPLVREDNDPAPSHDESDADQPTAT